MGKTGPKPRSALDAYHLVMSRARRLDNGCLSYTDGRIVGYGYRVICADGETWYVHRLVYFVTRNYRPEVVRHTCDLTTCVEPSHLLDGTHADNVNDMVSKKRHQHGAGHYRGVLSETQVEEIRITDGSYAYLGRLYGVSRGAIHNIKSGRTWKKR